MKLSRSWMWLLGLVLLAVGIARLRFDVEILNLLPERLPAVRGLKTYQQYFSDSRELIITLEAHTPDEAESNARALARVLRGRTNLVEDVAWQPPWTETPAELSELIAFTWLNQPPAQFSELMNSLAVTNLTNVLNATREQLATSLSPGDLAVRSYDPYGLMALPESTYAALPTTTTGEELFVSADRTFRLLFVRAKPEIVSYRACRAWLTEILNVIADARSSGEIPNTAQLHYTGRPAFVTEIAGSMENDMRGSAGGTLAIIGLLFWLTHRRVGPLVMLLFLLVLILGCTTALGGLFLGTVNVVSMGFAAILLGLAEDFGIVV